MNEFKEQSYKIHHLFLGDRLVSFNNCGDIEFYDIFPVGRCYFNF